MLRSEGNQKMNSEILDRVKEIYDEYIQSYRKGRERFGIWWTVFTVSMLSLSVVLILFAIVLAIFFL